MNPINSMKKMLYNIASQYISRATLIEGQIKNSNKLFRLLFIGNSNFINYVTKSTFSGRSRVLKRSIVWIPALDKIVINNSGEYDICISVIPKMYDERFKEVYNYKTNVCIGQIIDVAGTIEEIKQHFHGKKRQISNSIISKFKFTYRISKDLKDFELFYNNMFLPLIKNRYGDNAIIESYEEMKRYFLKGFLLLVLSGNQAVAGVLCLVKDNALIMRRTGALDADDMYIKNGAQNALYLFAIFQAKELGLELVDTMLSVSIMNNGVYRTKREWGAAVYPDIESETWVYFFIPKNSAQLAEFFEINPFIVHTKNGLSGLVGFNENSSCLDEKFNEIKKKYYAGGINNIIVITPESDIVITI
jgi:hypothetical protein